MEVPVADIVRFASIALVSVAVPLDDVEIGMEVPESNFTLNPVPGFFNAKSSAI